MKQGFHGLSIPGNNIHLFAAGELFTIQGVYANFEGSRFKRIFGFYKERFRRRAGARRGALTP
ncbi:hypothetical protein B9G55_04790 [Saccharibacillus sp. O16]|nr:hypothetical protein B9G55_04790 [Saccharibacillus sp. O16]